MLTHPFACLVPTLSDALAMKQKRWGACVCICLSVCLSVCKLASQIILDQAAGDHHPITQRELETSWGVVWICFVLLRPLLHTAHHSFTYKPLILIQFLFQHRPFLLSLVLFCCCCYWGGISWRSLNIHITCYSLRMGAELRVSQQENTFFLTFSWQ